MFGQTYVLMTKRYKGENSFYDVMGDIAYLDMKDTKFTGRFKKDFDNPDVIIELILRVSSDDMMRQSTAKKLGFKVKEFD